MRLVDVVGARPQFIKLAPVLRAIEQHNLRHPEHAIEEVLIHTGQHYDYQMSGVFFDELGLKAPDHHLGVGSGSHGRQTGGMLKGIEEVLLQIRPDWVIVYGDTNSTLAGALAAAKLHIPVAHVEAGLRSFNRRMPEEINRVVADHVSDLLFCPTETAVANLHREGFTNIANNGQLVPVDFRLPVRDSAVVHPQPTGHVPLSTGHRMQAGSHPQATCHKPLAINVGDVMYDAALMYLGLAEEKSSVLDQLDIRPKEYALATVHRAENTDDLQRLRGIFEGLAQLAREGLSVIAPLHPRTRQALSRSPAPPLAFPPLLRIVEPVSYLDMLVLEKNARVILTDSGGVQKEAFFFRIPCVTLREETEWVETVEAGWNTLIGCDPEQLRGAALASQPEVQVLQPYGDGGAAGRIVSELGNRRWYTWLRPQPD